mmetsp:Transcript_23797/g.56849  ORF Transcript_23797/g.56849 Transcript_23797/m.56849 type:complete len:784 (-) Transcript_23797:225-2576(-)
MAHQFASMPRGGGNQFGSMPRAPSGGQFASRAPSGGGAPPPPPGGMGDRQFASMQSRPAQNRGQPNANSSFGLQSIGGTMADEPAEGEAGCGLFFKEKPADATADRRLFVQTIIKGGAADRQKTVQVNDVITQVDGQDVAGADLPDLRSMILGELGTFATLRFEREVDGEMMEYSVSLMRGNAAYFAELKRKNEMQVEFDNRTYTLEELRKQVELMELEDRDIQSRSQADKQALDRLRGLLRNAEDQLAKEEATLQQEERMARELDSESRRLRSKKDQEERQLEELRALLQQSHNKLTDANDHIQLTRKSKAETEKMWKDEQEARSAAEEKDRQLTNEMEAKMEEDRRNQQAREQELLEIEEDRKKYEKLLREVQMQTDDVVRKKDVIVARTEKSDQHRTKIQQDNDRLITMLHDAEDARATIEQAKTEAQNKNNMLESELQQLAEHGNQRQAYVDELRAKAESERQKWEEALRVEQEGRREDNQRYRAREEELHRQTPQLAEELRAVKNDAEDKRRKLETAVMRAEQENKSVDAALKAEESLSEALRERISVLGDQLSKSEAELVGTKEELAKANAANQQAETDRLKALERERAMDAELTRERDAEQDKIDGIEELKKKLEEERFGKEQQVYATISEERKEALAKEEAEHALRRYRDDGQRLVDDERRRLEREATFKKQHAEYVDQLEGAIKLESDVKTVLDATTLPSRELNAYIEQDFIFPDTTPRMAKLPDAVDGPAPAPLMSAPAPAPMPTFQSYPGAPPPPGAYVVPGGRSMDNGSYI